MAATFKCELSWSASRAKEFERCRREYWYARYANWGWWTEQPRGRKFELATLKNLYTLPAFAGDCAHRAVARWLELKRGGTAMSAAELYEEMVENFRQGWRQSANGAWRERPNKATHLFEHQFERPLPPERTEEVRALFERCAQWFVESPELRPAREAHPDHWRALEALDSYSFLGTKVYAVPDFAYADGDHLHIWDWKTGRPRESDLFQLHTYALYACEKWEQDPEAITLHAAYLGEGQLQSVPVDVYQLSEVQDRMSASVREMMDVHYDPDEDPVVEEHWTPAPEARKCGWCRFQGVCEAAAR